MKTILHTFSIILFSMSVNAQFYDFVSFNKVYYETNDWTSVSNGEVWDDPAFEIPLPFNFEYYGETINTIYIMGEGYGAELGTKRDYDSGPVSILLPYNMDVIDRGYNEGISQSEIRYTTETTADNELFIIEWHNVGFYEEIGFGGESESYISFQVIFNKNFNAIELSFGESNIVDPSLIYEDNGGASVCLAQNVDDDPTTPVGDAICLFGEANNPDVMSINTDQDGPTYLVGDIPENKSYLFSVSDAVATIEHIGQDEVNIFPMPAVDIIQMEGELSFESYTILSTSGKLIQKSILRSKKIDVSDLQSGMYLIELYRNNGSKIVKPLIMK